MEMLRFTKLDSVLFPVGVFALFLAVWQFSSPYVKQGVLQLFMPSHFRRAYAMIHRLYAFIGYVVFGLMFATGLWIVVATINTVRHPQGVNPEALFACYVILVILAISLLLMVWREILTKKGVPVWDGDAESQVQGQDKATVLRSLVRLLEDNNKTINRILMQLEREDGKPEPKQ